MYIIRVITKLMHLCLIVGKYKFCRQPVSTATVLAGLNCFRVTVV